VSANATFGNASLAGKSKLWRLAPDNLNTASVAMPASMLDAVPTARTLLHWSVDCQGRYRLHVLWHRFLYTLIDRQTERPCRFHHKILRYTFRLVFFCNDAVKYFPPGTKLNINLSLCVSRFTPFQFENLSFSLDYPRYNVVQSSRDHGLDIICLGLAIAATKTLLRRTEL
jgi:hypothetical protein